MVYVLATGCFLQLIKCYNMKHSTVLFFALILSIRIFSQDIIIKDINIIPMTSDTVLAQQSVLMENGKIKEIGVYTKLKKDKNTKVIDGEGKYLMPGLADMHVHLPEEDKIEKLLLSDIAAGVTQIRVMNSSVAQLELRKKLNDNKYFIRPNIHYSHLIKGDEAFSEYRADSLMQQIESSDIDFIKLLSLSDEATFDNLMRTANKHNIIVCGHFPVYQKEGQPVVIDMEKVIESNFKSIEHLGGYIWLQDEEKLENALELTKENNIYNCPTLDWDVMAYDLQYPNEYKNRLTYQCLPRGITKDWEVNYLRALNKAGGKEKIIESRDKYKPRFGLKLKILKRLYEKDCLLLIGGDAGNDFQADGFNVYEEMMNWKNAGIDNYTILKSAIVTPSYFFNHQSSWGTIEAGKNAEMIILAKNPLEDIKNITTIEATIVGEKIYNNKELINKL